MNPDSGMVGWTSPGGMTPNGYSGWVSGRPIGPALPRPYDTFLSGAFGPFTPIVPMPLDQPAEGGDGRPAPRRWQYPVGWNLPIGQPGTEGLTLASFATLRNLAQRYSTLWGMLNLRVKELVGMEWDIGPTSEAQDEAKSDKALAKDQSERAKKLVDWFKWHIDPNYTDGFQSWYTAALWDQFIMDAVAVHPLPTREKGKGPFNSGLAHWELLDASCYSADTEVLTRRGWLTFDKVDTEQDEFATRSHLGEFEWHRATYFHEADHDGEMYAFTSRSLDLLVTPNHRMLVDGLPRGLGGTSHRARGEVIVPAEDLYREHSGATQIPATSEWTAPDLAQVALGPDPLAATCKVCGYGAVVSGDRCSSCYAYYRRNQADRPERRVERALGRKNARGRAVSRRITDAPGRRARQFVLSGDNFAAFMGMWLAEGCVTRKTEVVVSQRAKSKGYEPYRRLLTRIFGREPFYSGNSWTWKSRAMHDYLVKFGHALDKYVPDEIKGMSRRQLRIFWDYFCLGDGHIGPNGRQTVITSSPRMAGDLQEIAQKIGGSASVSTRIMRHSVVIGGREIRADHIAPNYVLGLRTSSRQHFTVTKTSYQGKVYCVSVPNEVLYVRRNGKPAWCGNSIRPLVDIRGGLPMPPAPAYQQYLFGVPRVDMLQVLAIGDADETEALMDAAGMSVDLDEMEPDGQYRADQLHYWRQTPWTNSPYGLSPVAAALLPIAIGIQRQSWLNDYWQEGSVPSVFVEAGPAYQTAQQQGQLQSSLNSLAGDVAWKHRILVLPPGSKASPQKDLSFSKEVDMVIMEYLYPVLQIQPQEIGQMPGGRSSGMMGGGAASQEMMTSVQRQRTSPDRKIWKARFDRLIQWDFKQADLEWRWVEFEEEEDAEKKAASEASDIAHGIRTIDQVIVDNGGDAWGLPLTSTPIYVIGTGILPLDPSVQAPAPIAPGGSGPGAPTGSSEEPVEPSGAPADGPDAKPAEGAPPEAPTGAVEQPRTAGKPQSGISTHPAPKPAPTAAPASGGAAPAGEREVEVKAVLADLAKWRIKYKDPKLPSIVHQYLLRSYPEKDVEWASDPDIEWEYEPHVDLSDVNWTRRPGGRDHDKEAEIAGTLADGASMDPVVLVEFQTAAYNRSGLTVADGFHRTGAADESGWKDVPAFVGRNVPDKYRPLVRGAMQDNSASVADQKKAALAELMVLRRYAKAGRDLTKFTPSALSLDDVLRFAADAAAHGHYHAFLDAASVIAEQDLTGMSVEQAYKAARETITKDNPNHDEEGRFASGDGAGGAQAQLPGMARQSLDEWIQGGGIASGPTTEITGEKEGRGFFRAPAVREGHTVIGRWSTSSVSGRATSSAVGVVHDSIADQEWEARVRLNKDISVTAPLATGLVPFDLEGARPNAEEEPEDEDKGLIPGHGETPLTTDATATLLAIIDAELTSRGIDVAKLA